MSELVGGMWTVAGFLGAACVIGILMLVFIGVAKGVANAFKKGGRSGGKQP